jgi:hypothetical protein
MSAPDELLYLREWVSREMTPRSVEGNYCTSACCPFCGATGIDVLDHKPDCYWPRYRNVKTHVRGDQVREFSGEFQMVPVFRWSPA